MNLKGKCILFDINHPAHVHYFRNVIGLLKNNGYVVEVTARDKDLVRDLLIEYDISYVDRGKGAATLAGRFFYYFKALYVIYRQIKRNNVHLVVSFMHPYAVHAARLCRIPALVFSDTETATMHHRFTVPFATEVHTSDYFKLELGKKHKRFTGFMELAYLGPEYFNNNSDNNYNQNTRRSKTIFFRFVSRSALHDTKHPGLSEKQKSELVTYFAETHNVLLSSEIPVSEDLDRFIWTGNKAEIHHVLEKADLFIGESATMACESAMLGTPAILIDNSGRGYTDVLEHTYNMLFRFNENDQGIEMAKQKASDLLTRTLNGGAVREKILSDAEDLTMYMYNVISKQLSV